ncbi:MAG TPA: L-seryl-tRNA(Sec) selenium transferase [Thermoleophilaceae bacterium]|nr:L-seryl-tRNA(Sec) selenium transferase [Thermoleophilaceae bacterium]
MARDAGSRERDHELNLLLRALPSVDELLQRLGDVPHALAVDAARRAIEARRVALAGGDAGGASIEELEADARARLAEGARPSLRRVLNATGVIVHTNLGRAPLADSAVEAAAAAGRGYSNLEYDLEAGERGSRQVHVEALLRELTGAEAAIVVNNCAAAVLLAAAALAAGRDLVVSRGQLVEIGGSFRVPDVVAQSGARLVEVGTTNRTRLGDYERALGPDTGAILRAHQSNFRTVGFVEEVEIEELCGLGVPVIDDVGSGALAERVPELSDEPPVRRSVAAGCAVVCFSGDKLLGGPQAGLMVGTRDAIERCRKHPLARALRIDKLSLGALEATLKLYRDPAGALREIPVLRMLTAGEAELRARAELICGGLTAQGIDAQVITASAKVGGGALPLLELSGPVCAVDPGAAGLDELARRLREAETPIVGRARQGWLLLDPRTLDDEEASAVVSGVLAALR